jgi:hypothetical protein
MSIGAAPREHAPSKLRASRVTGSIPGDLDGCEKKGVARKEICKVMETKGRQKSARKLEE